MLTIKLKNEETLRIKADNIDIGNDFALFYNIFDEEGLPKVMLSVATDQIMYIIDENDK